MSKVESADLIIKLYDLRREKVMRKARNWILTFNPKSVEEVGQTMMDEKVGPYLRMVLSYWDMVAGFVNHGAIDLEMFSEIHGEHIMAFAKIEPYLNNLRELYENPEMFKNLEKVINDSPNGMERVKKMQEWFASMEEQQKEQKKEASA